jgi:hypothetical protein
MKKPLISSSVNQNRDNARSSVRSYFILMTTPEAPVGHVVVGVSGNSVLVTFRTQGRYGACKRTANLYGFSAA